MPRRRRGSVFSRERLRPSQLRTVADRHWGDAGYLRNSGINARANGAMYLAGLVLECLPKAALPERHPWPGAARRPESLRGGQAGLWSLCYRSHDLDELLADLPEASRRVQAADRRLKGALMRSLKKVCGEWSICGRYSPRVATIGEAEEPWERVQELKPWLV